MKQFIIFFGIILLLIGCSSSKVLSDIDTEANFDSYKTYSWSSTEQPINEAYPQYDNSLNRKRWKNSIDAAMQREGFVLAENNADVEIDFHIQFEANAVLNPTYHDDEMNYYRPLESPSVYRYNEGSVTIHMVDLEKKQIVWQGVSSRILDLSLLEQADENIQKAVDRIFKKFHSQIAE
jgi:hypothetical protein